MYLSSLLALALALVTIHACPPGEFGCDHPGNFTGNRAFPIPSISKASQPLTPDPSHPARGPGRRLLQLWQRDIHLCQHTGLLLRPPRVRPFNMLSPTSPSPYPKRTLSRDDLSESPCGAPLNITNPHTKKTILASVLGECTTCAGDNIQLTTAGLAALSPSEFDALYRYVLGTETNCRRRWESEQSARDGELDF